jgi:hypothetical protein
MRPEIVKLQGLFRISGDALEIQHLKKAFDYGDDVDLSKCTPHSISGLCKLYLRYTTITHCAALATRSDPPPHILINDFSLFVCMLC